MHHITSKRISRAGLGLLVLSAILFGTAAQAVERIPRILFVGDSWTGFMWGYRSIKAALDLPEYAADGLSRWIETGSSTAIMGAKAYEFLSPGRKATVAKSLADNPNIDVVVMTLGGNDFSGGFPIPGHGNDVSYYDWFRDNNDSNPDNDWPETVLFEQMKYSIREILRTILAQRPDIRVAIVGYDWMCRKNYDKVPGLTIALQNQGIIKMEEAKRDLAMEPEFAGRVEYIQNLGVNQYTYGYFTSNEWGDTGVEPFPPARPLSEVDVPPHTAPLPGTLANGYSPWPGGDPLHQDPRLCYIDQDIHLQREGYDLIAKRALDVRIREWLNYPKVLSIITQSKQDSTQTYSVTFSEPVTGVDVSDFELFVSGGTDAASASVTGVQSGDGGVTWTVTADLGGASGDVLLRVLDDDTIVRIDNAVPLGGLGVGNGVFEFNGTYVFHDMLRPEGNDFNASLSYMDIAFQPYLAELMPTLSFSPDRFDANGSFTSDGGSLNEPYAIPGNTMLESYEFALITHMLNHPDLDLSASGGPKASEVIAAWNSNLANMQATLGGPGSIGDILLPGLDTMMAGYLTLDHDPVAYELEGTLNNSSFLAITLIGMLSAVDNFPTQVNAIDPTAYKGFPTAFSRTSDPDGDGFTNEQEYAYFMLDGAADFAAAALDPTQTPKRGDGQYVAGDSLRLALMSHPAWDNPPGEPGIQWLRNGQPLSDGVNVIGSNARCLVLSPLEAGDAGEYTCVYHTATGAGTARKYSERVYPASGSISVQVDAKAPNVVGLTQADAETALAGADLTAGTVTRQCSNTLAAGLVISQTPAAGEQMPSGSAVALEISTGLCSVAVPSVAGLARTAADAAISGAGLVVGEVTQQCSNTVAEGLVISQTPTADQQALFGSAVALIVSAGACNVDVPNVTGQAQDAAGAALTSANLTVGAVTQQCSNTVTAGLVISQTPAADQQVPFGSAVALIVSTGLCNVGVPNVAGQTQGAASTALTGADLTVGTVTQQCSNTVAAGLVVSQTPAAGEQAQFGSAVALVISTGLCNVDVPGIIGQTQDGANATLAGASLSVGTVTQQCSNTVAAGLVISQTPAAGEQAPFGSAVALVVSTGPCAAEGEGESTAPTKTQLQELLTTSFATVDENGDGQISYAEAAAALPGLTQATFNALDSGGDGQISQTEVESVDGGGCTGCMAAGKGAFTLDLMKKACDSLFLGGLSLMVLLAFGRHRP